MNSDDTVRNKLLGKAFLLALAATHGKGPRVSPPRRQRVVGVRPLPTKRKTTPKRPPNVPLKEFVKVRVASKLASNMLTYRKLLQNSGEKGRRLTLPLEQLIHEAKRRDLDFDTTLNKEHLRHHLLNLLHEQNRLDGVMDVRVKKRNEAPKRSKRMKLIKKKGWKRKRQVEANDGPSRRKKQRLG